ncbi:hypothetical protein GTY20_01710 [Streptomyces sp. SID4946]|uniref:hypothetical protein n=1 Tax=Streptomyces sp. LamerLS-31b TaxID=1839765 RepID=UPI00081E4379|nr:MULTISPECIES: hypothetical protein [unclassified Streptomyces]MYQ90147.1 hypothetical protein [Streptomyces sp. SID4946]SCF58652.1 hypothetical protein GA0115256_10285 [Streptomyces sp. DconLS]SCF81439.1 hypothetical protein GA0115258_113510 [Streptomyces sp. LamerLS-31b]
MATKTSEDAAAGTTAAQHDDETAQGVETAAQDTAGKAETEGATVAEGTEEAAEGTLAEETVDGPADGFEDDTADAKAPSGVGQGAGAVVSAALGLVSLSGGWIGTVAGARQQLIGQLRTSSTAGVATQIKAVYGDSWHTTALWAGFFALLALITGVVVLARPAFGAPGRPQAPWIKSVAWAGVSLGVIGLLLAVLKYSDALLALPSAS